MRTHTHAHTPWDLSLLLFTLATYRSHLFLHYLPLVDKALHRDCRSPCVKLTDYKYMWLLVEQHVVVLPADLRTAFCMTAIGQKQPHPSNITENCQLLFQLCQMMKTLHI